MADTVAYIRVSSVSQNVDRQLPGEEFDKVFTDKVSAKDVDRPALRDLIEYVREGDTVVVHAIDRLARNLADLESLIQTFNDKGATVEFRKESLTFAGGTEQPMQKLLLQMLGAVAEFERSMIRERQKEGIAAAKAAGKPFGRIAKLSDKKLKSLRAKRKQGVSINKLRDEFDLSRASVYRLTAKS